MQLRAYRRYTELDWDFFETGFLAGLEAAEEAAEEVADEDADDYDRAWAAFSDTYTVASKTDLRVR